MSEVSFVSQVRPQNQYDNAQIDVPGLFRSGRGGFVKRKNPFLAFYRSRVIPLKIRKLIWLLLTQTHVDLFWFYDVKKYWSQSLGLRPLWGVEDFYFLRNWYRIGFQTTEVADTRDPQAHLKAWQGSTILYFLLQQIYVESKYREFEILRLTKKYLRVKRPRYLEYGSGIGPITQTFIDFDFAFKKSSFTVSDLETVAFHFATQRFESYDNIRTISLTTENNLQLVGLDAVDCIFCITVFEHLNSPLETMQRFHRLLPKGGLLFFDYIKGEGTGLDTAAGVRERNAVLDFVEKNFEILSTSGGRIRADESLGMTLIRKL